MGDQSNSHQLATPPVSPARQRNPGHEPRDDVESLMETSEEQDIQDTGLNDLFKAAVKEELDWEFKLRAERLKDASQKEKLELEFEDRRREFEAQLDAMRAMNGGTNFLIRGAKPESGDQIHIVDLPGSPYVIRIFNGGMQGLHQYLLDFVSRDSLAPFNVPESYAVWRLAEGPGTAKLNRLISWEKAFYYPDASVPQGEVRYSVIEGTAYRAECPAGFVEFIVPVRTEGVQNLFHVEEAVQPRC
ncbi:uncharacterized protein C8Q71DRAFT_772940 [Rhodofomes roseus]|uniref:Uncharacterized protein n=1 Tax=Rhodofomes roseus TaxID=34475 RepID=A0ABQ8K982_9APHY|nr:uncharacterized protein C8Q71DRAFT_772940 [Rhodofomes roseus]KAH9833876.1 hypothetical protein C8Q71DRAFT_772940 [Rhodofomes roseus]